MSEVKFNSATQMPPKMSQDRGHAGSVGYEQARTTRGGQVGKPRNVGVLTDQHGKVIKAAPGMTLEPEPTNAPHFPEEENGMAPDQIIADQDDPQSQQTHQPPIESTTEKPEPVPTTAKPSSGGESDPTPGDADPGPTGGSPKPGYEAQIEEAHPVGYPSN